MIFRRIALALLALLAGTGAAQTTIRVPADGPTIQAAIDAGVDGSTVLVAPGTYFENLNFNGKQITLTSSGGAATTILDGSKGGVAAITLAGGSVAHRVTYPTVVDGFTIRNGGAEQASSPTGGIYVRVPATISNNVITGNHCSGIVVDFVATTIQGNEIDNTLDAGGGCGAGGGSGILLTSTQSGCVNCAVQTRILGNVIQNNTQGGKEGVGGGGLTQLAMAVVVQGNTFRNNASAASGGAIYIGNSYGVSIVDNLVTGNTAACGGSAFRSARLVNNSSTLLLANNTFADNTASGTCTGARGNGEQIVFGDENSKTYQDVFVNNIVSQSSGAEPLIACGLVVDNPAAGYNVPVFDHNLFSNGGGSSFDASCGDPTGTLGNQVAPPQFIASGYVPGSSSPAIDAGNTSVLLFEQTQSGTGIDTTKDFAGNARVQDATGKGFAVIDLGAYEVAGTTPASATQITLRPSTASGAQQLLFTAAGGDHIDLYATAICAAGGSVGAQGNVTFFEDGAVVGMVPLVAYTGQATVKSVLLVPGVHRFSVSYAGQGTCSAGVSLPVVFNVLPYAATLILASSANPSVPGQNIVFSVSLTSPDPLQTGPVTVADSGAVLATLTLDAAGKATYSTSTLTLGTHAILAAYAGDATHQATSAGLQQIVALAGSTTLSGSSDLEPSASGQPVDLFFSVNPLFGGVAQGTVTLSDGAAVLAVLPLDNTGAASYTTSALGVGTHLLRVAFSPATGSGLLATNASLTQDVLDAYPTSLRLTATPNPSRPGQTVSFTARLSSTYDTPTGTVRFSDGASTLGTVALNAGASATFATSSLSIGMHSVTATFIPNPFFAASASTLSQTVAGALVSGSVAASPEPSFAGVQYTLQVSILPAQAGAVPTGSVQFAVNGVPVGTAVSLTPDGQGGAGASILDGALRLPATYAITATYTGDATYAARTFTSSHQIVLSPTTTTLTPTTPLNLFYGEPADGHFAVLVAAGEQHPADGNYSLLDNGVDVPICTALPINQSCPYGNPVLLDSGTHSFTIHYLGDAYNGPSLSAPVVYVVMPDLTSVASLTSSLNPANFGDLVRFTAVLTGNILPPAGTVTFRDGASILGTAPLNGTGVAVLQTSALTVGTHLISVVYPGNIDFNPTSSGALSQKIVSLTISLASTVTLTSDLNPSAPNQLVTFTAAVKVASPPITLPAGTVTFTIDGAQSGNAVALDANGLARLQIATLAPGSHTVVASYSGATSTTVGTPIKPPGPPRPVAPQASIPVIILPAVSAALTQVVDFPLISAQAGFTLSVTPVPVTVQTGRTAVLLATVRAHGGFAQPVALACSGLPNEMTCAFGTGLIVGGDGSTTLALTPAAPHDCGDPGHPYLAADAGPNGPLPLEAAAAMCGLALLSLRRKPRVRLLGMVLMLVAGASALQGCGHCTDLGVRPGNYTFTVTATPQGGPVVGAQKQVIPVVVTLP